MTQDSAGRQQPEDGAQAAGVGPGPGSPPPEQPPSAPSPSTPSPSEQTSSQPVPPEQPLPEQPLPEQPLATPPPPPTAGQEVPAKKRRTGLIVALVAIPAVLLLCAVGGIAVVLVAGGADIPQAGECMTDAVDANDMEVIACDSADAVWSVIGSGGSMTRAEFSSRSQEQQVCQEHPGTAQALWLTDATFSSSDDTQGEVVCLGPIGGGDEPEATD